MDIENKLTIIEKDIVIINEKLDKILALLETDCKKMSNHIDFVETIYDNIKHPLNFVMNKVTDILGDKKCIET